MTKETAITAALAAFDRHHAPLWQGTIHGQAMALKNNYKVTKLGGKRFSIGPNKKIKDYQNHVRREINFRCGVPAEPITDKVKFDADFFYETERPDLNPDLIMDMLQHTKVIKNDRQIRHIDVRHHIDRDNPRIEIRLFKLS